MTTSKKILITGAAGFIGYHLSNRLIRDHESIICIDNLNDYYDVNLKKNRLEELNKISKKNQCNYEFKICDLKDINRLDAIFKNYEPEIIINLAAQAGVRYSLENPSSYIDSNIVGFNNLLECCRKYKVINLIYASSSSVYGGNNKTPFLESDSVDHPVSLYAATKRSNELMAHTYSHLFNIPATGLRFFTVYGPWGRPDMAPFIFTKAILESKSIKIFNHGEMYRDFTYIEDVIEALKRLIDKPAKANKEFFNGKPNPNSSWAPHQIFNIGNNKTVKLMHFIEILEKTIGIKAKKIFEEMPLGDVLITSANTDSLEKSIGYKPKTDLEDGIKSFVKWYRNYYQLN